jgi:carbamoyl-phosphate synthase large subunit
MEHIEQAGIHSGDSACALPPVTLAADVVATIEDYTARIARDLGVVGLLNVQFAVAEGRVYVLEANPRASRTVPLVSKVCAVHLARLATRLMLGESLASLALQKRRVPYVGVKEAVLPFSMFPEVDPVLGPEMRSTGEVLGIASNFGLAFFKAEAAAQPALPLAGNVLISVGNPDKAHALEAARAFVAEGFGLLATEGTAAFLAGHGVPVETVRKVHEEGPNILDAIRAERIQLIVNTPIGREGLHDDSYIRKAAIKHRIPYMTTAAAALAAARGIAARRAGVPELLSLQEWHRQLE